MRGSSNEGHACKAPYSPLFQVDLGTDDDTWYLVHAAEISDLVVDDLDHVEGLSRGNRVDEDVTVYAYGMLGIEYRVLILPRIAGLVARTLGYLVVSAPVRRYL